MHVHMHVQLQLHTHMHTHMHTHVHTHMHTHVHTHVHMYLQLHMHMRTAHAPRRTFNAPQHALPPDGDRTPTRLLPPRDVKPSRLNQYGPRESELR